MTDPEINAMGQIVQALTPLTESELARVLTWLADRYEITPESSVSRERRNNMTASLAQEVAEVYRSAAEIGTPPTQAVADHFQKSHSTAARWVGQARKAGELGPARAAGGRGGES